MVARPTSLHAALGLCLLAACVWACTAGDGEAPPPATSRESAAAADPSVDAAPASPELPEQLSETGLYVPGSRALLPEVLQFAPQYPLWSDGATKRRFVRLPAGGSIDASTPEGWLFPVGTRFWKEFSFGQGNDERRVETRYMERRANGSWTFASYVWDADGKDARLAPERGLLGVAPIGERGLGHDVPSRSDCLACHEGQGRGAPVLGFSALQLSSDRDPLAPHAEELPAGALDLDGLRTRGLLTGETEGSARPSIRADSPEARASLGYLHANCAGCHNRTGPLADLGLDFEQTGRTGDTERVLASLVHAPSRFRLPGAEHSERVVPGAPEDSVLGFRIGSRSLVQQMPPLGSKVVDQEATLLLASWIQNMQTAPRGARKETP